jgi:hypothetical protein
MKRQFLMVVWAVLWGAGFTGAALAGDTGGMIMFAERVEDEVPEGKRCEIPIETNDAPVQYNFRALGSRCKNDEYSWFRLDNAPSAVVFSLGSDAWSDSNEHLGCKPLSMSRWVFELRTIRERTNTKWYRISELEEKVSGDLLDSGGLRLEKNYFEHGQIDGKLSCVIIDH